MGIVIAPMPICLQELIEAQRSLDFLNIFITLDDIQIYVALFPKDVCPIDSLCLCHEKLDDWMQKQDHDSFVREHRGKVATWFLPLVFATKNYNPSQKSWCPHGWGS